MFNPTKVSCPNCKTHIRIPSAEVLERGVECPSCGKSFARNRASSANASPSGLPAPPKPPAISKAPSPGRAVKFVVGLFVGLAAIGVAFSYVSSSIGAGDLDEAVADSKTQIPKAKTPRSSTPIASNTTRAPTQPVSSSNPPQPVAIPNQPVVADTATFQNTVKPFFAQHCVDCHGADLAEGKLRLDTLPADFLTRQPAAAWVEVLDRLNLGEMPPKDEPRPDAKQLAKVTDWITAEMARVQTLANSSGGQVLLRRLTRSEYTNTVRDLFGITFFEGEGPQDMLPPDGSIKGFNKLSKALLLDPSLMEKYLVVAEYVVDKAVATRPPKAPSRKMRFEFEDTVGTPMNYLLERRNIDLVDDGMLLFEGGARTFGKLQHPFNDKQTPVDGEYIVRVRAGADVGERAEPIYMDITKGANGRAGRIQVNAPIDQPKVYEVRAVWSAALGGELQVSIVNGTRFTDPNFVGMLLGNQANKAFDSGDKKTANQLRGRARAEGVYGVGYHRSQYTKGALDKSKLPKLFIDWVELEGPVSGQWPPASRARVFQPLGQANLAIDEEVEPGDRSASVAAARKIVADFLPRAFRRPVTAAEIDGIINVVSSELDSNRSFEDAMKTGFIAMLCSPDFLYLFEPADPEAPTQQRQLTDAELASRMSYFIWSSMPDEELSRLAANNHLRQPDVLIAQVDRLLSDKRADALVDDFAAQWLRIADFDRFQPDERIFRDYYANQFTGVGDLMNREPLEFFREILRKDASVLNFLDADWTMANAKLAAWYGINGVQGDKFQRVSFPADSPRGGLLTMAGVSKWGSDGNRTKPVERGKYILDVLFNDPPPPPPPNAGEVEPNLAGQVLTVRERLEKHRHVATCRNCHRRIDPYGLAMENFNVIGQWRDNLDGEKPIEHWGNNRPPIECNGTLPNGKSYSNFTEFKQAIVDQSDRFERALAEKLLMYALGRTLEASDRPVVLDLVQRMHANSHTLRSLIQGIVSTDAFARK